MRGFVLGAVAALVFGGFLAWRVEAGDGAKTLEERVAALEAKVADHEARLAKIPAPAPAPTPPPAKPREPLPRVLTAEEFRLVDGAGKTRMDLSTADDGGSRLALFDATGAIRGAIFVDAKGAAGLSFGRGAEGAGVTVGFVEGRPLVMIMNDRGSPCAQLLLKPDGMPAFSLWDAEQHVRAGLSILPDGSPVLSMGAKDEQPRATLTVAANDSPIFVLTSKDKPRCSMSVGTDGAAEISVLDEWGQRRAALSQSSGGTGLFGYAPDGKAAFDVSRGPHGGGGIHLRDGAGHARFEGGIADDGRPGLRLLDESESAMMTCMVTGDGVPVLTFLDASAQARTLLGGTGLVVTDVSGRLRLRLESLAAGSCGLWAFDATGKPRATIGVLGDGWPVLGLTKEDGTLLWEAKTR